MDGSICLTAQERKTLLKTYRSGGDARVARRAQILLLLADGWSWRQVQAAAFASNDLISNCVHRYREGGVEELLRRESPGECPAWLVQAALWLRHHTPRDFSYFRSRWSCEILSELLWWEMGIRKSPETIRRGLHQLNFVWRRPRPIVGPTDELYEQKLRRIQTLLATLPDDETAVFQDEVDVNLNPKIGNCWMPRGQQMEVVTPGNNVKRHVAGSLHWRTGRLIVSTPTQRRNAQLFVNHLDDVRRNLRGYRKIHVILDNARFHDCQQVREYLSRWGHRIKLHFLPKYAPETNPIERVWWHLHETVTRNHKCQTIHELIEETYAWFEQVKRFPIENSNYAQAA